MNPKPFLPILLILFSIDCMGQPGNTADVSITSISITEIRIKSPAKLSSGSLYQAGSTAQVSPPLNDLKCTITVHNDNSGQAFGAMVIVLLPVDVNIISNPMNATINRAGLQNRTGMPGSLVFDLTSIATGGDRTIEFTFSQSTHPNKVTAYVYSSCPDPNPSNNYKEGTL